MPQPDATGHPGQQAAAIDAGAGPGATAILQGMLETLSEVLGALDQRLGRLEARLDDVTSSRDATAQAVSRLGTGMSHLVARLDSLAAADDDDEPAPVVPPVEVDIEAVAEAVAGRLDGRLSALSELTRLDRLDALDGLDHRLSRLDQSDAALLDAVTERLAPLDGLAEAVSQEVTARVVAPLDGLGEGVRMVLARLGDLTDSVDNVGAGLGSLSEALAADDDTPDSSDAVDMAAVVADESERLRAIVAGLGQAVTAAHADITAAVAAEAERTREAFPAAVAAALAETAATQPDLITALAHEAERIRVVVAEAAADHPDPATTADAVVARVEVVLGDAVAAIEQRHQAVAEALDRLASSPAAPGLEVVERSLAAAQADLRQALDDAVLLVTDRQDAQATAVRQAVDDLRTELARLAEGDDEGPDLAAAVADAAQASERSVARMHADLRSALDEVAAVVGERHESHSAQVQQALGSLTQAVGALRGDLASLADADRPADDSPDVATLLDRHAADVRQAIDAVAAAIPRPPDVRGALDDALLVLADRQEQGTGELRHAIDRLRSELAEAAGAEGDDGTDVAELLARHAEGARSDLARLETVLRGQVAEVSGRAGSITDVIGRLDGRLHEVVDGVRSLSRHLEATATLVPAVEALRAEVDELRRLYEQPRLRAVNGGE